MSLVFEKLTQTLAAGQVWRLTIAADFFRIAAASWPVKVRILKAGRILGEMDGWQAGDFVRDVEFDAVEVEAGTIAQTVTVQIAGGGVGSDRVIGEVSIIDGAMRRTESGQSFAKSIAVAVTAGNYGATALFNPAASGVKIELLAIKSSAQSAMAISVGSITAEPGGSPTIGSSKKAGGPNAFGKLSNAVGAAMYPASVEWLALEVPAGAIFEWQTIDPLLIEPGWGVAIRGATTAISFRSFFEWREYSL